MVIDVPVDKVYSIVQIPVGNVEAKLCDLEETLTSCSPDQKPTTDGKDKKEPLKKVKATFENFYPEIMMAL
jgi:hypothetical protein